MTRQNINYSLINIIIIILEILALVLINVIPRGNFLAAYVYTVIYIFLMLVQFLIILISTNSIKKWVKNLCVAINFFLYLFLYYIFYGYIFELS